MFCKKYTFLQPQALGYRGVKSSGISVMSIEVLLGVQLKEAVNTERFEDFIINALIPVLNPLMGT